MEQEFDNRSLIVRGLLIFGALLIVIKLIQIQILDSKSYQSRESSSIIQNITLYPSRGLLYDRNNELLVNNNPLYDVMVIQNDLGQMDTSKFCDLLKIDSSEFENNLSVDFNDYRYSKHIPHPFLKKISAEVYTRFQESLYEFPGFYTQLRNVRGYPRKTGCHVLGYISEVDQKRIDESDGQYTRGDYGGSSGLEKTYEKELKGKKGVQFLLKNNLGQIVESYDNGNRDIDPQSGHSLFTTLDISLQKYCEQLLNNKRGSIVAIEPATGEILALVSSPNYNPELLAINRQRGSAFKNLEADSSKPFFNRAIMAQYPPGSIFKPIMSLVALQEGTTSEWRRISCPGYYQYNNLRVNCRPHAESISNIHKALKYSCNTYYCQVFRETVDKGGFNNASEGLTKWAGYLSYFGIGSKLNVDLPNEAKGFLPNSEFYNSIYGENKWKSPYVISLGIGQGELLITPLQMANLAAALGNKGYFVTPHLGKYFLTEQNERIETGMVKKNFIPIDSLHFNTVLKSLGESVKGKWYDSPNMTWGGKTGTAQNPHGEDHSVFMSLAPLKTPQIAVSVFIENGGGGSAIAAPLASLVIEKYLSDSIANPRKWIEKRMLETEIKYD